MVTSEGVCKVMGQAVGPERQRWRVFLRKGRLGVFAGAGGGLWSMRPSTGARGGTSHCQPWVLSRITRELRGCSYQIVSSFPTLLQNSMRPGCQNIRIESSWQKCSVRK